MSEERIEEIERILGGYARRKKHIIDVELCDARGEFVSARFERERILAIPEKELTDIDSTLLDTLVKEYPKLRNTYFELRETLEKYIKREEELEKELEELLKKIPPPVIPVELIDVDEETGYLIFYNKDIGKYFRVRPEDYGIGKIEAVKYYDSLEIAVNFTFDTYAAPLYEGGERRWLEAEVRITVRVEEAGKMLADVIPEVLKLAFERHVSYFFEQGKDRGKRGGGHKRGISHTIAKGVDYDGRHEVDIADKIKDMLGVKVLKVGCFYRINDEDVNMDVDGEICKADVSGEWSRQGYSESVSQEFDVEYELGQPLHWIRKYGFVGNSGWEELKKVKEEEE